MMESIKIISQNKKAFHDFHLFDKYEAGIVLTGTEVKSIKAGSVNLKESYVRFIGKELFLIGCHISEYKYGNLNNHDPIRERKLLMHKIELIRLLGKIKEKGYTIVPTKIYLIKGTIKLEIALAKGKKQYDKRESLKKKDAQREMERVSKWD